MSGTTEEAYASISEYFDTVDERLEQVCDTVLKPRLDALEADRQKVRGYVIRAIVIAAIPAVLFFTSDWWLPLLMPYAEGSPIVRVILEWWTAILIAIAVLALAVLIGYVAMPGVAAHLNYRRKFKQEVVSEIFRAVSPDGTYQPDHHLSQEVVDESGFFSGKYQTFNGDDLIRGRVGSIEFEASEIRAKGSTTLKSGKSRNESISARPNLTDFGGTFFHFGVGQTFRGHTIIEPETIEGRFPRHRRDYQQVAIEDAAFTELYRVYSTDPSQAAQILTPALRTRLLGLNEYCTHTPLVAFVRNKVFVAVHEGRTLFEPTIAKKAGYGLVSTIGEFFATPSMLVRELGLESSESASRFGSGPAASILARPAAQTFEGLETGAGGTITPDAIMKAAMPEADEKDAALPTPPASRVRLSPMTGEALEASFGLHPGYYVRVVWALVLAPFAIGGLARLAGDSGLATFDAIVARLPPLGQDAVVQVANLAVQWPIPFVIVVLLFWALPTWAMLHVPRALRIDREGAHVKKRVWPIGKRYPLDRIAGVTVTEKQVYLTRKNTSIWRRYAAPAPPMRSPQDAKWLAAHVRRALVSFGGLR